MMLRKSLRFEQIIDISQQKSQQYNSFLTKKKKIIKKNKCFLVFAQMTRRIIEKSGGQGSTHFN